ncbi:putative NAD/FAD-binding protein [Thioflavicoccus mobilis 8321]|uniref:Putative NAD/FAD-binding protein n=1 Tax=Thioflavicoccus mobilis 8321 TaxID=765912 RepID=L0GY35_9GAMM|nr:FAD-dependent oxidoreductase [Thioflavicoccus mobilis]AGA91673.1 putative NAD/FAD-binding protein [Thioflavicoccus mobilis 8321]
MGKNIAVIGGGIAGLATACLLNGRHRVTLIERNGYIGGHARTIEVDEDDHQVPIDTGFIVYNEPNYPLLTRLFDQLGVATRVADMSFAASIGPWDLEYATANLDTLFAQRRNLLSPAFLRMCRDVLRFNRRCRALLAGDGFGTASLGEFLERERLGEAFRDFYLLPVAASIWSCPKASIMQFPAASLARFYANHGLLNLTRRPPWKTVVGGARQYIARMLRELPPTALVTNDGAEGVARTGHGIQVRLASGRQQTFDNVVMACHADQALRLLETPTEPERCVLGAFSYQPNRVFVHTDEYLMPRARKVWSSWNHLARYREDGEASVSVTYWMNRLGGLEKHRPYFVSLNPFAGPRPDQMIAQMAFEHPVFDQPAIAAQARLDEIQGRDRIWFCGSYFGQGYHEDALRSAVAVAAGLGGDVTRLRQPTPDTKPNAARR